jgi:cytosine/adenosine deaminase-related metal-dependent hydrolase
VIAEAFDKVGVSHLLCYEITDRDGQDKAKNGLVETERYLRNNQGLVGLHASFTVSDDTLSKAVGLMQKYNSGIHIHVAEDEYDQHQCVKEHGKRVVKRLHDFGVLESSKTILGHCLHLTDAERELVKNSEAFIVQNTESNLNNNVGFFNSEGLGNRIMLGTDGMHSDMIRSAQAAFFVGRSKEYIDFQSTYNRFVMVHNYLKENEFLGDGDNNLVVLDYDPPTEINQNNFLGHFIFGFSSRDVQHVISDGKLIVKDRKVCCVNEEEVMEFAREQAVKLWKKL